MMHSRLAPVALGVALLLSLPACSGGNNRPNLGPRPEPDISFTPPATTVSLVLGHTPDLGITESQLAAIVPMRRQLDSLDAPLYFRLDSLRPAGRPVNPRDLSTEQREESRTRSASVSAVMDRFRENNLTVRSRLMDLLSERQQEQVAALEEDARKKEADLASRADRPSDEQGGRRGGGGRGGRGGAGGGRPPQD